MVRKNLRFGSRIKHKGQMFFVTDVTPRTIKARRIFDVDKRYNPNGSLSNVVTTIKRK